MKTAFLLLCGTLVLTLFYCGTQSKTKVLTTSNVVTKSDLLKQFKEIEPTELHIWFKSSKTMSGKFQGTQLDTLYFPLFGDFMHPYKQYYTDPKTGIKKYCGYYLFASYKFTINDHLTGLILRGPSQYDESRISLWIYDRKKDILTESVGLADGFGDENWYFSKDSWIEFSNNGLRIISRQLDHEINETTMVDSVTSDKFEFYKFTDDTFKKIDTIEINKKDYKLFYEK